MIDTRTHTKEQASGTQDFARDSFDARPGCSIMNELLKKMNINGRGGEIMNVS